MQVPALSSPIEHALQEFSKVVSFHLSLDLEETNKGGGTFFTTVGSKSFHGGHQPDVLQKPNQRCCRSINNVLRFAFRGHVDERVRELPFS